MEVVEVGKTETSQCAAGARSDVVMGWGYVMQLDNLHWFDICTAQWSVFPDFFCIWLVNHGAT